jgi:hypothetical protein
MMVAMTTAMRRLMMHLMMRHPYSDEAHSLSQRLSQGRWVGVGPYLVLPFAVMPCQPYLAEVGQYVLVMSRAKAAQQVDSAWVLGLVWLCVFAARSR